MIYTGQELTSEALEEIGAIGAGQTADADDAEASRRRLNRAIDSLGLDSAFLHTVRRVTKTLAASTASYTIGDGGDIDVHWPSRIDRAALIIDTSATPPTETPIEIFTDQRWQAIPQKAQTGTYIQGIHYDHDYTSRLGRIEVSPVPTSGTTQLVLYVPGTVVRGFDDLTTPYSLPDGYAEALVYQLAKRLAAGPFGKLWTPTLEELMVEATARVKRANRRPTEMVGDVSVSGGHGGRYDIFTNQVRRF